MDTKQRIIKTALRIFLEKGYERTSLRQIASETGITKGGIYHYFESKEHLFRDTLRFITSEMEKWSTSRFHSVRSARDMLESLFGSIRSMKETFAHIVGEGVRPHPYSFIEILINAARRDEGVRREMETTYSRTRNEIKEILVKAQDAGEIRGDTDCEALALEITALIEGLLLLSVLDETVDLDAAGDRIQQNIWAMIGT